MTIQLEHVTLLNLCEYSFHWLTVVSGVTPLSLILGLLQWSDPAIYCAKNIDDYSWEISLAIRHLSDRVTVPAAVCLWY